MQKEDFVLLGKNLGPFEELKETDFCLHPLASAEGGLMLQDKGGLIPDAVKDMLKKIGAKLLHGEFNIIKTPAPAKIHTDFSHLTGLMTDHIGAHRYLTPAA